jgi:hypothetical protein
MRSDLNTSLTTNKVRRDVDMLRKRKSMVWPGNNGWGREKQPLHMVKERNESSMKLLITLLEQ